MLYIGTTLVFLAELSLPCEWLKPEAFWYVMCDLLTKPFNINLGEHLQYGFFKGNASSRQKVDNVKVSKWMGVLAHNGFVFQLNKCVTTLLGGSALHLKVLYACGQVFLYRVQELWWVTSEGQITNEHTNIAFCSYTALGTKTSLTIELEF